MTRLICGCMFTMLLSADATFGQSVFRTEHVIVDYSGPEIEQSHARALARVTEAARRAAIERFGFEVPETINIHLRSDPSQKNRLHTDGRDTFTLEVSGVRDLAPPPQSGTFNLYGMCHELGHVVMYRPISDHTWLTSDAAEGWAHYFGSVIVDDVYAAEGEEIWPKPYDYRADGTQRLHRQLARDLAAASRKDRDGVVVAAGLWMELVGIVGEKKMPELFAAWGKTTIDPTDPTPAIHKTLKVFSTDARLDAWWAKSQPHLWKKRPRSDFAATAPATAPVGPAGKSTELALDDGTSAGKFSFNGGGHAVMFEAPADGAILTAVKIFGSRYGTPQPPKEDFHVFLCDEEGKVIREFTFPYKSFLRGEPRWVTLKCKPTAVPKQFILAVSFNPSASKGVYVHHDSKPDGDSRTGLPPDLNDAFGKGDWMIRALVGK